MKAVKCSECGGRLEAGDNEQLFEEARQHFDQEHPDSQLDESRIRAMVGAGAYEKQEMPSGERPYSDDPEDESAGTF